MKKVYDPKRLLNQVLILKQVNIFTKFIAYLYIFFSEYSIIYSSTSPLSEVVLVHFHERVHRKDIDFFLRSTKKKIGSKISIIIFKRRFAFPTKFKLDLCENFYTDNQKAFNDNLMHYNKVAIFFPHSASGIVIQNLCMKYKKISAAFQHGYYSYSPKEQALFSKSTFTDYAFIFNKKFSFFFKNCRKIFSHGNYFIKPKKNYHFDENCKDYIFLSILNSHNLVSVCNLILSLQLKFCKIRHHPNTTIFNKIRFYFLLGNKPHETFTNNFVGKNNYFIDTTLWTEIDTNSNVNFYMIESRTKQVRHVNFYYAKKLSRNSFISFTKGLKKFCELY